MFKIVKKKDFTKLGGLISGLIAITSALIAAALIISLMGYNPLDVFSNMLEGSIGSKYRVIQTINKAIPLLILSLGIAVAFKMKFWNIGAEGQFYMGAFGSSFIALNFSFLPIYLLLPLMILIGFIFGGLYALIPAIFKIKFGTSETLVTLMMNYIALKWISYLQFGPWKDPSAKGFPRIAKFQPSAVLPKVFGIHIGWMIALILVVLIYILFKYTKLGYEIRVLGENITTAKYAGMSVTKIIIISMLISGGLCGIAGMIQASGVEKSLTDQLSGGLGFTAIITAWLARLSSPLILIVSLLFSMLIIGGSYIQSSMQIPSAVSGIIQGIILFFVLGSEFFTHYKIVYSNKKNNNTLVKMEADDNE